MSTEARKVDTRLNDLGIETAEPFDIELDVNSFYPNHIIGVIDGVVKRASGASYTKAVDQGYAYFSKPVRSQLTKRSGALRGDSLSIDDPEGVRRIFRLLSCSYCVADFNRAEFALIVGLATTSTDVIISAMQAAKRQGNRSIYYLNGIVAREVATAAGKLRESQAVNAEATARAWEPPTDYERMDASDIARARLDWARHQDDLAFQAHLDTLNAKTY
jgi:hypothetical protein